MYKFEIYKDKKGEFRFRFRASNGEIMFSSEGYKAKASAKSAIESIKKNAPGAETVEE
ncbi:MAG: YegP family protein [Flavobacteriaceae bacterium]